MIMSKQLLNVVAAGLLLCSTFSFPSMAQVTTPRTASPAATVMQTIGISTVEVNYSRPAVREREIWGSLVPYGWNVQGFGAGNEAPWRAGANENTTITFSHETTVAGTKVPAGTYGLFFVINEGGKTGEVVLSQDYRSWGSFWYDSNQDVMRANIELNDIEHTERLTYDFHNITANSADLVLNWEKKQFPVSIEIGVNDIVLANAREELKGSTGFSWQAYRSAASYLMRNNHELDQALQWIDVALQSDQSFATQRIKVGILKAMGQEDDADKMMASAIETASEPALNAYGYQLLNQQQHDKAIEMFKLNTERHPKSANAWDSLGEGYTKKGEKEAAIKSFKKSLSLNPAPNVKANSEKYLKQLGAM